MRSALRCFDRYTRPAPKITKPRPNVIIRLCSIECDFAHPLTHPTNDAFREDMDQWAKLSKRTYIWNYVTGERNPRPPHRVLRSEG